MPFGGSRVKTMAIAKNIGYTFYIAILYNTVKELYKDQVSSFPGFINAKVRKTKTKKENTTT